MMKLKLLCLILGIIKLQGQMGSLLSSIKVVGMDVCKAVKQFFQDGQIPGGVNATTIALVPKLDTPLRVSEILLVVMYFTSV